MTILVLKRHHSELFASLSEYREHSFIYDGENYDIYKIIETTKNEHNIVFDTYESPKKHSPFYHHYYILTDNILINNMTHNRVYHTVSRSDISKIVKDLYIYDYPELFLAN